jgi:uncharacterized protein (TIGR02145 family)
MNRSLTLATCLLMLAAGASRAQTCDPSTAPQNPQSSYTPGVGALVQWDAVPGSEGIQILATQPFGPSVSRRVAGFELNEFLVDDALLSGGTYTWRVLATCSPIAPYVLTPASEPDTFAVPSDCPSTVVDVEGNVYPTAQIGSQCWMAANLQTESYANGDPIATGLNNADWINTTSGAFAVYNDDPANKLVYGLLYNFHAGEDPRGLCPVGWHVPNTADWETIIDRYGGSASAGGALKSTGDLSAGTGLWQAPNTGATNVSGFSALPGGFRSSSTGAYSQLSTAGYWWRGSVADNPNPYARRIDWNASFMYLSTSTDNRKQNGFSIRCLKD